MRGRVRDEVSGGYEVEDRRRIGMDRDVNR